MQTRRQFIKSAALGGAGLAVGGTLLGNGRARAASVAQAASAGKSLTPYVDPMPLLVDNAINATGGAAVNLTTALVSRKVHRDLPPTTLFGYLGGPNDGTSYLGPVIVAKYKVPVVAKYTNNLASGRL